MGIMDSFSEIVETFGQQALADDVGVPKERARQWWRDDSIHSKYWKRLLKAARKRRIKITPELLIDLADRD